MQFFLEHVNPYRLKPEHYFKLAFNIRYSKTRDSYFSVYFIEFMFLLINVLSKNCVKIPVRLHVAFFFFIETYW